MSSVEPSVDFEIADNSNYVFPAVNTGDLVIKLTEPNAGIHMGYDQSSNAQLLISINDSTVQFGGSNAAFALSNGQLLIPSGIPSKPALSFSNDRQSGIYLASNASLAFSTAGQTRLIIDQSNVGIGKSNPQYLLDVAGTANFGSLLVAGQPVTGTDPATSNVAYTTSAIALATSNVAYTSLPLTGGSINGSLNISGPEDVANPLNIYARSSVSSIFTTTKTGSGAASVRRIVFGQNSFLSSIQSELLSGSTWSGSTLLLNPSGSGVVVGGALTSSNTISGGTINAMSTLQIAGSNVTSLFATSAMAQTTSNVAYSSSAIAQTASNVAFATSNVAYSSSNRAFTALPLSGGTLTGALTTQSIIPSQDLTYDLGSSNLRFRDLYLSSNTIYLGNTKITHDTSNNLTILDANNALKRIVVDEIQFGDTQSTGAVRLKRDTATGAIKFQQVAQGTSQITEEANLVSTSGSSGGVTTSPGMNTVDNSNFPNIPTTTSWSVLTPRSTYFPIETLVVDSVSPSTSNVDVTHAVAMDSNLNVYLTGTYNASSNLPTIYNSNNTPAGFSLTTNGGTAAFVVKYDSNGTAQWIAGVDSQTNERGTSVAVDSSNSVIIAGTYTQSNATIYNTFGLQNNTVSPLPAPTGSNAAFIVKYDQSGIAQWSTLIDSASTDIVNSIDVDRTNSIVVAGTYEVPTSSNVTHITPTVYDTSNLVRTTAYPIAAFGEVRTIAGSGTASFSDATGTNARFNLPRGVAVDSSGNIYVADTNNHRIRKITASGIVTTLAGSGISGFSDATGTNAQFSSPCGVAVDSSGNIYVADQPNHRIRKVTAAGVVTTLAGSGTAGFSDATGTNAQFYSPSGVTVDSSGNVYVADLSNNRIRKITSTGIVTTLAGSGAPGFSNATGTNAQLNFPTGVTVDQLGNVYVTDSGNNRIRKITSTGVVTTLAGSGTAGFSDATGTNAQFTSMGHIAIDLNGNIYVAHTDYSVIRKITQSGVVTTLAGKAGNGGFMEGIGTNAQFVYPYGVAVDLSGNVYVADSSNNRIRRIETAANEVSTLIGLKEEFNSPYGIVTDASGNGYIADRVNHCIRKISTTGEVTLFAGMPNEATFADGVGTNARFNSPRGLTIDSSGTIYIADELNHRIRTLSTTTAVVTTLAGNGTASFLNGTGTGARFRNPYGVAVDTSGNLYVADANNNQIRKIVISTAVVSTLAGAVTAGFSDASTTSARFNFPRGVAVDTSGIVYVADDNNHRIRRITAAGAVTTLAGTGTTGLNDTVYALFNNPYGVAVDSTGNIYVADAFNHRIRKITSAGIVTTLAGSGISGFSDATGPNASFRNPYGVAIDSSGNVYVADQSNHRIRKITSAGVVTTLAGSGVAGFSNATGTNAQFYYPIGVAVDSSGNVYVADTLNQRIRKITQSGVVTTLAGSGAYGFSDATGTNAQFWDPYDVTVDSSGNVYVGDYSNNRIRKITSAGVVTTLAGSGVAGFSNATGTNAQFYYPIGVAVDSSGNVYVGDHGNQRIRKITSAGVVTTLAGSGLVGFSDATGTNAQFNYPFGVAVDSSGNVYVGDYVNHRIRKITSTGVVTTFAGVGVAGFADTVLATFTDPGDVTINPSDGFLYVSDTGNNVIRQIRPSDGFVSTIISTDTPQGIFHNGSTLSYVSDSRHMLYIGSQNYGNPGKAGYRNGYTFGPYSATIDSSGNIFVADRSTHSIRKITNGQIELYSGSGITSQAGSINATGTNARFNAPTSICQDSAGNLYVADQNNNLIRKITPDQQVTTFAGTSSGGYVNTYELCENPIGVVYDSSGNLYISDASQHLIRKITPQGQVTTLAGGGTSGFSDATGTNARFRSPLGMTIDSSGNIYVADQSNHSIRRITAAGVVTTVAGYISSGISDATGTNARFNSPRGVAIDSSGNLFVADTTNHRIRKITVSTGLVETIAGSGTATFLNATGTNAGFNNPYDVKLDSLGNIYVADYTNRRIRRIDATTRAVTTFAGSGTSGITNGTGTSASFVNPRGLAIDATDNIYVSDSTAIRKITSAAVVTTQFTDFSSPKYIAVDTSNQLYYVNNLRNLYKVDMNNANATTIIAGRFTGTIIDPMPLVKFSSPYGIATDSAQNLYVSEIGTSIIRKISPSGIVTTLAGIGSLGFSDATGTNASFWTPWGLVTDSTGNVYVADYNNHRIRRITPSGVVTTLAGSGTATYLDGMGTAAGFNGPTSVVIDSANNLYVSEIGNELIRKISPEGVVTTLAGTQGGVGYIDAIGSQSAFNDPYGIAIDALGNLYVADTNNSAIRKISAPVAVSTIAGTGTAGFTNGPGFSASFNTPSGIITDIANNLYVADYTNHVIRRITQDGTVTTYAGSGISGVLNDTIAFAQFRNPRGLCIDSNGNIYVADEGNHTIRKITVATNQVTTLAGSPGISGTSDGVGTNARFRSPYGIAVDSFGNVYATDFNNHTIRRITPDGTVTTLLGLAGTSGATDGTGTNARLRNPYDIAIAPNGVDFYISDTNNHTIKRMTISNNIGTLQAFVGLDGSSGSTDGTGFTARFRQPGGLVVDRYGDIYLADHTNNEIRKITPAGVVSTIAGTGTASYLDGVGTNALLNSPRYIAIDSSGNMYFTDSGTNRIRKITPPSSQTITKTVTVSPTTRLPSASNISANTAAFAIKYDQNGISQWSVTVDGVNTETAASVTTDHTVTSIPSVYIVGEYGPSQATIYQNSNISKAVPGIPATTTTTATSAFGLKITNTGIPQWAVRVSSTDKVTATACDVDSTTATNFYMCGTYTSNSQLSVYNSDNIYTVSTFAGSGTATIANATGTNAGFKYPMSATVDNVGNIYVTDLMSHNIRRITPTGVVTNFAGSATGAAGFTDGLGTVARFIFPSGIHYDKNTNKLYITEQENHTIRVSTLSGQVTTLAGNGSSGVSDASGTNARFNTPTAVAVDSTGNVYVVDQQNTRIRRVTQAGDVTTFAGTGGGGGYIDDTGTNARFNFPYGIAIDSANNLYVSDTENHCIRKIDITTQQVTTFAGTTSAGSQDGLGTNARFNRPHQITIDEMGNLYVADLNNYRIRKITPQGLVTTIAGSGSSTFANGIGTLASFVSPIGIAIQSSELLYVLDAQNYRIRRLINTPALTLPSPTVIPTSPQQTTAFISKFNSNGIAQWATYIPNAIPYSLKTDNSANVYIAGTYAPSQTSPPIIYGATPLSTSNTSPYVTLPTFAPQTTASNAPTTTTASTAAFVVKYNSNGNPMSAWAIIGASNSTANSLAVDPSGSNIVIGGSYIDSPTTTIYDANGNVSIDTRFPQNITGHQAAYATVYQVRESPFVLRSSLPAASNGLQKYVTNAGTIPITLNVTSSNNLNILTTHQIPATSNATFRWFGGNWYRFN